MSDVDLQLSTKKSSVLTAQKQTERNDLSPSPSESASCFLKDILEDVHVELASNPALCLFQHRLRPGRAALFSHRLPILHQPALQPFRRLPGALTAGFNPAPGLAGAFPFYLAKDSLLNMTHWKQ